MPIIDGAMEWGDSSLRPGFNREVGLLTFDSFGADGSLQESAGFMSDEEDGSESAMLLRISIFRQKIAVHRL